MERPRGSQKIGAHQMNAPCTFTANPHTMALPGTKLQMSMP
ncbi:hypothetical protein [Paenibacillus sp. 453mf]|nr:hypothetical protein [Paenibacillus sp. 453mf]